VSQRISVSIVQARPVYYDLKASLEKAVDLITQAAQAGARLVVLGETWLPGYPMWMDYCPGAVIWDNPATKDVFLRLHQNSVAVPGEETALLGKLAKSLNIVICIGINEKATVGPGQGTLYNTLLTFDATGEIINHHRKLMPTYGERLVWGPGDAVGLCGVDSAVGRIGGLICWEHWMPLPRQILHNSGEQIHVAAWPGINEMHQVASRHYAFEGRCFVLAAGSLMRGSDLPSELEFPPELADDPDQLIIRGGSAIIAPDGRYLAGPVFNEETIISAEIDLSEIVREQLALDVTGHYARPELFELTVLRRRNE